MNIQMIPLEIYGLKSDLNAILHTLRDLGSVHIDNISEAPEVAVRPLSVEREMIRNQEQRTFLLARIEGLNEMLKCEPVQITHIPPGDHISAVHQNIEKLVPQVKRIKEHSESLKAELSSLPRYETTLKKLLPLIPSSAHHPGNVTIGILVNRMHVAVLDSITRRIFDVTSGRSEVIASDVDEATRAMLIVFPEVYREKIDFILGQEDVARLRLPAELGEGPPDLILVKLRDRMAAIPGEIEKLNQELISLKLHWCHRLSVWRAVLQDEIEENRVVSKLGETDLTFVLMGWVPVDRIDELEKALNQMVGEAVFLNKLNLTNKMKERAPVIQQNPPPAKPFESLVNLLAIPRYGHIDPTRLMAFFMPIFFGMMLGDVIYGLILLLISLFLTRRFKEGLMHDILIVLSMGSGWSIVFGFLYGEALGTLGAKFGLQPIWFERASKEHVASLLMMSLIVGAVHITLGLILGVWEAIKERKRSHLLERGGMLLGLCCLFLIVGVLMNYLPDDFMTPAISGLIIGIVLLSASLGWLGILIGPIEFIGLIGNVLSYLRIAAIGLASVYLAKVANDVAGMLGSVVVGVILAVLVHSLNLVMGAFSPTIHSLRLHYVEFFRKFYEGGGNPYKPFKSRYQATRTE